MKKLLLILFIALITGPAGYCPHINPIFIAKSAPIRPLERLWWAQGIIESSGNPMAYNPKEKATGIVQVTPVRLLDYNLRTGKSLSLKDCFNPEISKAIWTFYAKDFYPLDYEGISKAWNCNSEKYWQKVQAQLKNKSHE